MLEVLHRLEISNMKKRDEHIST